MTDDRPDNPAPELIDAGATLEEIEEAAAACVSCHLYENATQTVFGDGPGGSTSLMMVGEQPGDSEDQEGEPFVGPSGRVLDSALDDAGIDRATTYVTNVVKHFKWKAGSGSKPRLHAKPNRGEIRACRPWLDAEIERTDPAVIVCLGATAAQALLGYDFRVTRDHGRPFEMGDRTVVATIHPSAVLRSRDDESRRSRYSQLVDDLEVAAETASRA